MIFPEGLTSEEEFRRVAEALGRGAEGSPHLLANMTEFGVTPHISLPRFGELGYSMVIYPVTTQRLAMHAVVDGLRHLRDVGDVGALEGRMQTREQLYDLLSYEPQSKVGWRMPRETTTPRASLGGTTRVQQRAFSSRRGFAPRRPFSSAAGGPPDRTAVMLPRTSNQALEIGKFATDWVGGKFEAAAGGPDPAVKARTVAFFVDSVVAGVSALALGTNAPNLLRDEALGMYARPGRFNPNPGATVFGSAEPVAPEKAIAANVSAVREWDTNGTVFGYEPPSCSAPPLLLRPAAAPAPALAAAPPPPPRSTPPAPPHRAKPRYNEALGHLAGEFGHNDFYPVPLAAAQVAGLDGKACLSGMMLLDEIRGRLCEVSLQPQG